MKEQQFADFLVFSGIISIGFAIVIFSYLLIQPSYLNNLVIVEEAQAAVKQWTGASGTQKVSDPGNWSGGVAPANGDSVTFVGSQTATNIIWDGNAPGVISSITVSNLNSNFIINRPLVINGTFDIRRVGGSDSSVTTIKTNDGVTNLQAESLKLIIDSAGQGRIVFESPPTSTNITRNVDLLNNSIATLSNISLTIGGDITIGGRLKVTTTGGGDAFINGSTSPNNELRINGGNLELNSVASLSTSKILVDLKLTPLFFGQEEYSVLINKGLGEVTFLSSAGAGYEQESVEVIGSVVTADTTVPSLIILHPEGGATVTNTILIQASTEDESGIESVKFKINGVLLTTDNTYPFTATLDTTLYENGEHNITAIARDNAGNNSSVSNVITIKNLINTESSASEQEAMLSLEPIIILNPEPETTRYQDEISIYADHVRDQKVSIIVESPNAEWVRIYFKKEGDVNETFLGNASNAGGAQWGYTWYASNAASGKYVLIPKVRFKGVTYLGKSTVIEIHAPLKSPEELADNFDQLIYTIQQTEKDLEAIEMETISSTKTIVERYTDEVERTAIEKNIEIEEIRKFRLEEFELFRLLETSLSDERKRLYELLRRGEVDKAELVRLELKNKARDEFEILKKEAERKLDTSLSLEPFIKEIEREIDELNAKIKVKEVALKKRGGISLYLDSDADGVSDYDELNVYITDPLKADTDFDGIIDSDEILGGTDPQDARNEPVIYEDPRKIGTKIASYRVDSVEVVEKRVIEGKERASKIKFKGQALPNSFVTIFIYSSPITVTVKADNVGKWVYTLDKELDDGTHEIYVATVDNSGKILAKSDSIPFVKQAAALELGNFSIETANDDKKPGFLNSRFVYTASISLLVIIIVVLFAIGFFRSRHEDEETAPPESS